MIAKRTIRRGFTLMDAIAVMWGLGICLLVGMALIITAFKSDRLGEASSNRLSQRTTLANQFRTDVARAESAPDRLDDQAAGPACLILQQPGGKRIVYLWKSGVLERFVHDGEMVSRHNLPVGSRGTRVEFDRSAGTVITMRISERVERGPEKQSELSAALARDIR